MGVSQAGFEPIQVIEWDRWCCDTIRENKARKFPLVATWPVTEGDVRDVDFRRHEGKIDLVTGGPPCQPFSVGGKHRGHRDTRDMWPEALRAIRESKPQAFIFENVKGLTRATFASYLAYIVHQLSYPEILRKNESWIEHLARLERHHTSASSYDLKYQVVYRVLNAADYGVPQKRERVVFVGFRDDLEIEWAFPERTHSADSLIWDQCVSGKYWERHNIRRRVHGIMPRSIERAKLLKEQPLEGPWRTVRDAISDLPDPRKDKTKSAAILNHRYQPGARPYPGHTGSSLDEPAKTLKAGVHGVPGGENMFWSSSGLRYFTVRESARLQTFPDEFALHGSWSEAMRQLGNAVPVQLAETIGKNVASCLG